MKNKGNEVETGVISGKRMMNRYIKLKKIYRECKNFMHSLRWNINYLLDCRRINLDYIDSLRLLEDYSHRPQAKSIVSTRYFSNTYNLTIIIPVYQQAYYLTECIDSVFSQISRYTCQVICVDDGSFDISSIILDELLLKKNDNNKFDVQIVHEQNGGLSAARNCGLSLVNGDYVMFLDSDDKLLPGAIQNLLNKAYLNDADIVEGNGYRFDENGIISGIKEDYKELTGFACLKVYKSKLWENIVFPNGYLFEDTIISTLIYPRCKLLETIPEDIYAYRFHYGSITNGPIRSKLLDTLWIMLQTFDDRKALHMRNDEAYLMFLIAHIELTVKWRLSRFPKSIMFAALEVIRHFLANNVIEIFDYENITKRDSLFLKALNRKQYDRCLLIYQDYRDSLPNYYKHIPKEEE